MDNFQNQLSNQTAEKDPSASKFAVMSIIMGIIGMIISFTGLWFTPLLVTPFAVVGLFQGIRGRNSSKHTLAIIGVVFSLIELAMVFINISNNTYMKDYSTKYPTVNNILNK